MSDITGDNLYWTAGAHNVGAAVKVETNNDPQNMNDMFRL